MSRALALLRRERLLVAAGVAVLCALSWLWLLDEASGMSGDGVMSAAGSVAGAWGIRDLGYLVVMWSVMMVAMMLPSATPTILLFATLQRNRRARAGAVAGGGPAGAGSTGAGASAGRSSGAASPGAAVGAFVLGYLLVWTGYGALAAGSQWLLHRALLVSPAMVSASPWLSGGLLVAAGAYQLTPLKDACVGRCRSPLSFLTGHWREGTAGALRMGAHHGTYCVGCCWALMALLFVLGVMNLLWVLALALFVLVEKTLPRGAWVTRVAGAVFLGWGAWVLLGAAGVV